MTEPRPPPTDSPGAVYAAFLSQIERRIEPLLRGAALADWRLYTGRSPEGALRWQLRRNRLLSTQGLAQWARDRRQCEVDTPIARRFELLERMATEAALEQHPSIAGPRVRLQRKIAAFRPSLKGRQLDYATVAERLAQCDDREDRREAWYVEEPLYRPAEKPLIELVLLRNERAKQFGFRSYPEYRLGFEGFSVSRLEELLEEAGRYVRAAALRKRDRFEDATGLRGWFPWDVPYADELEGRIPEMAFRASPLLPSVRAGVRGWGFGARAMGFRADEHDFSGAGIEIPVDPPRDVRVVYQPGAGWLHYDILFHEVGHAVHMRSLAAHSPVVRWHEYIPGFQGFGEGIGALFEAIPQTPEWLRTRPGIGRQLATQYAQALDLSGVATLGFHIAWIRGELELYRNPEGDVGRTQYRLFRRLGGYDAFEPHSFANSFCIQNPVYLQSYLFATLFAKQLLTTIRTELGDALWPNPRLGPWLTENWFRHSGEFDWVPHLRATTGQPFGARAFNGWARAVLDASRDT